MSTFERNLKGLLGTKLGMTQTWDENNRIVPVTVIAAGTNVVTQVRTPEKDGYNAIQIGFGEIDGSKVTKPSAGHFGKAGVTPRRHVAEIRTTDAPSYEVGQELGPDLFAAGQEVDVTGHQQGQGLRRCDEAARLPRRRRLPRCPQEPPQAGLDRRLRDPGPCLQGHAHGRSHG